MHSDVVRGSFYAFSLLALTACAGPAPSCGTELEYDPAMGRCTCPDRGIYVCDSPDDCRCVPRDAGVPDDAGEPDAGMPEDAGMPDASLACAEGETICGGTCVDTQTSRSHCGTCANACASGTTCELGDCIDSFIDLAAGYMHVCGVRASGSVWCWGYGRDGQLGNGMMATSPTPVQVEGITSAVRVDAMSTFTFGNGSTYTCALLGDATMKCWGHGTEGNLGDRGTMSRSLPVAVIGVSDVRGIGAGAAAACALLDDETVTCWGSNEGAQMGTGMATTELQLIPAVVPGLDRVRQIDLGWAAACAVRSDNTVACWGLTAGGAARGPTNIDEVFPTTEMALSVGSFCALGSDGVARCWGELSATGVADPTGSSTTDVPTPVVGGSTTLRSIYGGSRSFCGIDEEGVICWDGPPVRVDGTAGATDVAIGRNFACAIIAGRPWCWGENETGQLGTGTYDASSVPVPVVGLF